MTAVVRVELPHSLSVLAGVGREVSVRVEGTPTLRGVIDALEAAWPALGGTLRDRDTGRRRPLVRFFACEEDLSHQGADDALPGPVIAGEEALLVVGAIAGG